jgi:hypothetical protein
MELRNVIIGYLILLCACVSFGQTAVPETAACETRAAEPPHATAAEQTHLAQRFVDGKVALWRQRLKLENWRISAVMAHQSDMVPKTLGAIKWDKSKKNRRDLGIGSVGIPLVILRRSERHGTDRSPRTLASRADIASAQPSQPHQ